MLAVFLFASTLANAAQAETEIRVSTAAELLEAVHSAEGGERILLAPGDYGSLALDGQRSSGLEKSPAVTITSADKKNRAVFDAIYLRGVRGIVIDTVMLDYKASPGESPKKRAAQVIGSDNVAIRHTIFDGDKAQGLGAKFDGYGTGFALVVENTRDLAVENNEIYGFTRGAVFGAVDGLVVSGNDIHDLRSDGMDFFQVTNVLIENNYLHDFDPSIAAGDHPDMIQFWSTNTVKPSADITIRGNVFDSNKGSWTQSLFMRNEMVDAYGAGPEMFYRNIQITDNVIRNAHAHGIFVGETDGLVIRNNTVVQNATTASGQSVNIPRIRVVPRARNVEVTHNVASSLAIETKDSVVEDNLLIQRESEHKPNFMGDLFVDGLVDQGDVRVGLRAIPGGQIETRQLGAAMLRGGAGEGGLVGRIDAAVGSGEAQHSVAFSVNGLSGPEGEVDLGRLKQIAWEFGDGATAEGLTTRHDYAEGGRYAVRAVATLDDDSTVVMTKTVTLATPVVIEEDFNEPMTPGSEPKPGMGIDQRITFEPDAAGGKSVRLNGGVILFKRRPEFLNNREFTVLLDYYTDPGDHQGGRILNLTRSLVIEAQPGGGIGVAVETDKGQRVLRGGTNRPENGWRRLRFTFSGETGEAALYINDKMIDSTSDLKDALQPGDPSHDLILGNPWKEGFGGRLDNFQFLSAALKP